MREKSRMGSPWVLAGLCVIALTGAGCATYKPEPPEPRVSASPNPAVQRVQEAAKQEEMSGELVSFGKLRTVVMVKEQVIDEKGAATDVSEIKPELEKDLVERDFRVFSNLVLPDSDIAKVTRETKAQLVIGIDAKSELVNSTGRFSKFRAEAEGKAVRGHDGTVLAVVKVDEVGPRNQDADRAGKLALRQIAKPLADEIVKELMAKTDQLCWAGLVINNVASMDTALYIQGALEKQKEVVSYVELLDWNKEAQVATYEIIYGLKHESDVAALLGNIPHLKVRPTKYTPGKMEVLRKAVSGYK